MKSIIKRNNMTNQAYIYDAIRTPRSKGKQGGSLNEVKPFALAAGLLKELQSRHHIDTSYVDDVILGCVTATGEQGGNIAKAAVQAADWDESVPAMQLSRFCASGLEAVNTAAQKIASGWENLIVAGGVESMSRVPMSSDGGAWLDPEFTQQTGFVPQGIGADMVATLGGWSREDVDRFAVQSQKRAAHAQEQGYFKKSVVPVKDRNGMTILAEDNFIRPNTNLEILGGLKASFEVMGRGEMDDLILSKYNTVERVDHVHTGGNSSGIVDGASVVLIGSEKAGNDLGLNPRGRIVAMAVTSTEPTIMLVGPGPAAQKCLTVAGLTTKDIDLWEINEAFASVAMRYMKDLGISSEITNVNGGAIALGHPLGATGGMMVSIMLDELERRGLKRAMLSLCAAGGMGISTIIERV